MTEKSTASPYPDPGLLVRRLDGDRFACAMLAEKAERERLMLILAFNAEISRIFTQVHEPIMGQMRLQWWREVVEAALAGQIAPPHEVARPLGALIAREPALAASLLALIEAHERDLDPAPMDLGELASYARSISAPVLHMFGSPAPHVATGYTVMMLLQSAAYDLAQGRNRLGLAGHRGEPAFMAQVRDIAQLARHEIDAEPAHGQARYWQALARLYLARLRRCGYDITDRAFCGPHPLRGVALLWASLRK